MAERKCPTTDDELVAWFDGIMIPVEDIAGKYRVPGWRCKACGWAVGALGYPPSHQCPEDGDAQEARRRADPPTPADRP